MNRIYLSKFDQLKCNFCTEWFSALSTFASVQKYSLNACHKCLNNFQYRIVHPDTYEIYDVLLIRTGIKLVNETDGEDRYNCEKGERLRDMKAEVDMHMLPIKERVSDVCRKFMDGIIGCWGSCLTQIQKGSSEFDTLMNKMIRGLIQKEQGHDKNGSQHEFVSDQSQLKIIFQQIHKISTDKMLGRIKSFLNQFLTVNFARENQLQMQNYLRRAENQGDSQNKQNKTPNKSQLKNIRDIRAKLMKSSRRQQNLQLKPTTNLKPFREGSSKSSKKSFLQPSNLTISVNYASMSSSSNPNTPRSFHFEYDSSLQKSHIIPDEIRDQIVKNLKQKVKFESYLPIELEKPSQFSNRTYGQKNLIDYHLELFQKTTVDQNICELINENICKGNLTCYLNSLEWKISISMVRFVKCKMGDLQFDEFLNWLSDKRQVSSLVLSNNLLTYLSVTALWNFCLRNPDIDLKQVYLGNNFIKPSKARRAIQALSDLGVQVHI